MEPAGKRASVYSARFELFMLELSSFDVSRLYIVCVDDSNFSDTTKKRDQLVAGEFSRVNVTVIL